MTPQAGRDVVVVGGGRAGMSAALAAARAGADVCLIDEREALGGSCGVAGGIGWWRPAERTLARVVAESGIETLLGTVVWGLWDRLVAFVRDGHDAGAIEAGRLIVATGGHERPVVFPGWTLPGVMTVREAQSWAGTLAATSRQRVLVAGSGPGLSPLAARLHRAGADVVLVVKAMARPSPRPLAKLALALAGRDDLAALWGGLEAVAYLRRRRVPVLHSHVIARAGGAHAMEHAVIARVDRDWRPQPGTERTVEVDAVCVAYGFVPSTELTMLGGAAHVYDEIRGGRVPVYDEWMRTTAPGVLVAGHCAGAATGRLAAEQGRLAGIAAAMDVGRLPRARAECLAAPVRRRLARLRRLGEVRDAASAPGPGLDELAGPDTIVCRCEAITMGQLVARLHDGLTDLNSIKAATRAGMGPCQARSCVGSMSALVARHLRRPVGDVPGFTPRPPARPVRLGVIADERPERPRAPVID